MLSRLEDRFLDKETFYIAFKKVKAQFELNNAWVNAVELSTYEGNLTNNLNRLITQIKNQTYTPKPLQVLPYPKKSKDGKNRLRQYFRCSIDDQIIWTAIAIVVGPSVEERMPVWSYGNRLFKPIWYENIDGKKKVKKGSLNNTSEHIYRKWTQSWPFYRRHITMTVRILGENQNFKPEMLEDEKEAEIYSQEKDDGFEFYYLDKTFWNKGETKKIFWAGLDFKAFFPTIPPSAVISNFHYALSDFTGELRGDAKLIFSLIEKMFTYPLDTTGWSSEKDLLDEDVCNLKSLDTFSGIPTGLLAAGFLANVAMIDIDRKIDEYIRAKKSVAVFKYVDDHVVLSKSNEDLFEFLNFYDTLMKESKIGVSFQTDKLLPKDILHHSDKGFSLKDPASPDNVVDIEFPKPLITQTLQKMSELNSEEFELKDDADLENSTADLEHFLLADFPDEEMRRDTRISFAAMKLSQLSTQITPDFKVLMPTLVKLKRFDAESKGEVEIQSDKERTNLTLQFTDELGIQKKKTKKRQQRILKLLLKAVEENPDKLKLWRRCVEVCHISGSDLELIFQTLAKVEMHGAGKTYIHAYILEVVSDHLITAYNQITSSYPTFWKTSNAVEFLNNQSEELAISDSFGKETFPFCVESKELYKFNLNFVRSNTEKVRLDFVPALKTEGRAGSKPISPTDRARTFHDESYYWNLLGTLNYEQRRKLWQRIASSIDLKLPLSWSILSLYPKLIQPELFERMKTIQLPKGEEPSEFYDLTRDGEGVLLELFEVNELIRQKYLTSYPIFGEHLSVSDLKYVPLNQWLSIVIDRTRANPWTDIRLSEWTILEIIRQIAVLLDNKLKDPFDQNERQYYKVHPSNYLIPRSWYEEHSKTLTWARWEKLTKDDPVRLIPESAFIDDFRYFPIRDQWRQNYHWFFGNQFIIVTGLSVLTAKLISKTFDWPATTNKLAFIDKLFAMAAHSIEHQPVSSDTRIMLNQNFSKDDMDFLTGYRFSGLNGPVRNLTSLVERIEQIQKLLTNDHLTLVNHAPRQLTTIDIDKLNVAKSIF